MSRQPGQDYPDILLERYLAGDLGAELRDEIEWARDRSEILRDRLEQLERERQAFLAANPPQRFAQRLAARVDFEAKPARRRWLAWLIAPSAAAAAAAVLVALVMVEVGPEQAHMSEVMAPADGRNLLVAADESPQLEPSEEEPAASPIGYGSGRPADKPRALRTPPKTAKRRVARPRKTGKKGRSGGGATRGGGGRVGELHDAAPPPPAPRRDVQARAKRKTPATPKSAPAPAAAAESLMSASADRGARTELAKNDIQAGVKKGLPAVTPCIQRARDDGELTAGRHTLTLSWDIEPSGKVTSPRLVGPASLLKTTFAACLVRGMRAWRFPSTTKRTPVRNFPLGPMAIK